MIHVKQAVIVEGKYDKIKLSNIIDALIITTDGFQIYKNKEKLDLIRRLAETTGVIILTDSDGAGMQIRSYLKSMIPKGTFINVYIPDIKGKEKRKDKPSKAGYLGVEGISGELLADAFEKAGISSEKIKREIIIDKAALFNDGLTGAPGAAAKRKSLQKALGLPELMSANTLIEVLNTLYTYDEYKNALKTCISKENNN